MLTTRGRFRSRYAASWSVKFVEHPRDVFVTKLVYAHGPFDAQIAFVSESESEKEVGDDALNERVRRVLTASAAVNFVGARAVRVSVQVTLLYVPSSVDAFPHATRPGLQHSVSCEAHGDARTTI